MSNATKAATVRIFDNGEIIHTEVTTEARAFRVARRLMKSPWRKDAEVITRDGVYVASTTSGWCGPREFPRVASIVAEMAAIDGYTVTI